MKKNWQIKKLGEVCEINIGRTPERGNSRFWDKEKKTQNVWLSIADLNNAENGYVSDSSEYVSDMAVPKMKLVKANTLLMSFKLTIGRCAITKRNLFTNEAIAALPIQTKDLDLFFLKYYLESFNWDKLTEGDTKVKGKTLNKEKLNVVPIVVPPLEEQKRIVAVLDKKFAQIETLKTAAEKNLQNTKQLFQAELEKAFSNTSWEKKRLGDVCDIINGKNQKQVEKRNGTYPIYGSGGVMGYASEYLCRENTTIIGRKGSINNPIYVEEKFWNVDTAFGLQSKDICLPKLLFYFCKSFDFTTHNKGTTIPSLVKSDLLEIIIPLPPLEEQKHIVAHLDSLSEKVHQLEEIYTKQLADCDELKQSLLQKAFEGEL